MLFRSAGRAPGASAALVGAAAATIMIGLLPATPAHAAAWPEYVGQPHVAQPVTSGEPAPQHPWLAPNGSTQPHEDAYASDASPFAGPNGVNPALIRTAVSEGCGLTTLDSRGRLLVRCRDAGQKQLRLVDPVSLETLFVLPLPDGSGGYAYTMKNDAIVMTLAPDVVGVVSETADGSELEISQSFSLRGAVGTGSIVALMPDWYGRVWFVTNTAVVGFLNPATNQVRFTRLSGEKITNGLAADESGAIFAVTDRALYRFTGTTAAVVVSWRVAYDRGTLKKPGQAFGSGTTPTLIRYNGKRYVAINDNASPRMHVLVFRANAGAPSAPMCSVPVFAFGRGASDNSIISMGNSLFIENNYGYTSVNGSTSPATEPGLARIDIDFTRSTCTLAWTNNQIRVPNALTKGALASGLVFVYEHPDPADPWFADQSGVVGSGVDAWYLTAVDIRTGERAWSRYAGTGSQFDSHWAGLAISPSGTVYLGVASGLIAVRDAA